MRRRVLVIGLDGAPAACVFREMATQLPTLAGLVAQGQFGVLRSCHPPITVPAWASMLSGLDPGELGVYGFRYRPHPAYDGRRLVHSGLLPPDMIWDWVGLHGGRSVIVGVPPTFPPPRIAGVVVSCLLAPRGAANVTAPPSVQQVLRQVAPDYKFDIADFRSLDDGALWQQAVAAVEDRFRLARELARREPWDLFVLADIGSDRVQHGLWEAGRDCAWGPAVRAYYQQVDRELGRWLAELPDDTCVWVVSDHGAQASRGGVYVNEWLRRRGWLRLHAEAAMSQSLPYELVDWERTLAWAEGGYVGRVYLNVRGREPRGVVAARDYHRVREELRRALCEELGRLEGEEFPVLACTPEELYRDCRGFPPDLFLYVDGLRRRVFAGLGSETLLSDGNDTGRDRANHHPDGLYICYDPRAPRFGPTRTLDITEVRAHWQAQLSGDRAVLAA